MIFFSCQRVWKTAKCQKKIGKSQGILRWMISGNPVIHVFIVSDSGSLRYMPQNSVKAVYGEIVQNEYIKIVPRGNIYISHKILSIET